MMKDFDFETWRLAHGLGSFSQDLESGERVFGIKPSEGAMGLIISHPKDLGGSLPVHDIIFADLMEHTARSLFQQKPDGDFYKKFVEVFGQNCTDDLMSIVRHLQAFDDTFTF